MSEQRKRPGMAMKALIVVALAVVVGAAMVAKNTSKKDAGAEAASGIVASQPGTQKTHGSGDVKTPANPNSRETSTQPLPKLVDLGAGKCIPCKMMAPILEELKEEYQGKFDVVFIDVWENPDAGKQYGINLIPTQIFYDASGKELFRHEGFFAKEDILAKWKEVGIDFGLESGAAESFSRLEPVQPDTRAKEDICYMCDGDIDPKTQVTLQTPKGDVHLCSPHCYFITYSSLTDKDGVDEHVQVADWTSGKQVRADAATYLIGQDDLHRPTVKAFADKAAAEAEMKSVGGNLADWRTLEEKELANRCGFCDRAVYPEDAARVKVGTLSTWGCCPMCALGVAARLQKDIEIEQKDALTGEMIRVVTLDGSVASLEPKTAVAWAGQIKGPDGKMVSAGCFKQAFFATADNLRKWAEMHPTATGQQISINQALIEKMKLTPEQISKACKIGECSPR